MPGLERRGYTFSHMSRLRLYEWAETLAPPVSASVAPANVYFACPLFSILISHVFTCRTRSSFGQFPMAHITKPGRANKSLRHFDRRGPARIYPRRPVSRPLTT